MLISPSSNTLIVTLVLIDALSTCVISMTKMDEDLESGRLGGWLDCQITWTKNDTKEHLEVCGCRVVLRTCRVASLPVPIKGDVLK
jgi:hypothetical protein